MRCIERCNELIEEDFDNIIIRIRNGKIKCGRYAHLVKIDKGKILKGKEFFTDGQEDDSGKR